MGSDEINIRKWLVRDIYYDVLALIALVLVMLVLLMLPTKNLDMIHKKLS